MKNKILKFIFVFFVIFSSFTVCLATTTGSITGETRGPGEADYYNGNYVNTWPYSGSNYDINITKSDGTTENIRIPLEDGDTRGSGGMQGYASVDYTGIKNPLPNDTVNITADNIEQVLRNFGYNDLADEIANGADYYMSAQQMLKVLNKDTNKVEWLTIDEIKEKGGNYTYHLKDSIIASEEAWYDIDDDDQSHGIYWRKTEPTPTPTPTPTDSGDDPSGDPSDDPSGDPSGDPSDDPSGDPSDDPSEPEQVTPEISVVFQKGGPNSCDSGPQTSSELKIVDDYFGVGEGHHIPTSEDLDLNIKTNWIANLKDIEKCYMVIDSAKDIWYEQYYIDRYVIVKNYPTYETDESGETVYAGHWSVEYASWKPHETAVSVPSSSTDEYGYLTWYSMETIIEFYDSKDVSEDLEGQSLEYIYTGDAKVAGGAKAKVKNAVLPGGEATVTVNDFVNVNIVMEGNYPKGCFGEYDDPGRCNSKDYELPIKEIACCRTAAIDDFDDFEPSIGYFFNNPTSDNGITLQAYGVEKDLAACNRKIVAQDFGKPAEYKEDHTEDLATIPSDRQNATYPTTYGEIIIGGESEEVSPINSVYVHTPLHATLTVTPTGTNQLTNDSLRNGSKIIKMGEKFTAELVVYGSTDLYDDISQPDWPFRMKKYIKYASIYCGFCGQEKDVTSQVRSTGKATHTCTVYVDQSDDLQGITVIGKVVAENIASMSSRVYENRHTNTPNNSYAIEQDKGLFIVGRVYDLEVRVVDDPTWKIGMESLNDLPTGENGDNKVSANSKNGIALGYRAYYDLKTLGTGSEEIQLIPKIYYVNKSGTVIGEIGNEYELWFRTGNNNFEKWSTSDIPINMSVLDSYPDKININFNQEKTKLMERLLERGLATIDYSKLITNMGGLLGLTLRKNNTVATKYTYLRKNMSSEVTDYTKTVDKSRRWYGEIYIPGSARIIASGNYNTNKLKVLNGTGIEKDGYLLVTFESIKTYTSSGAEYLKYDEIRDAEWNIPSGVNSEMVTEKAGKGLTRQIKLPNGVDITSKLNNYSSNFYKTEAPVIIYDISRRGNDDVVDTGTH